MKTAGIQQESARRPAWVVLPALQVLLLCLIARPASGTEWLICSTFLLITAFSSWQLFADKSPFSLNKIWWLFSAVFMGIAPSAQMALHHSPWREGDILPATMVHANVLILGCLLLYTAVRYLLRKKIPGSPLPDRPVSPVYTQRFRIIAIPLLLVCGTCLIVAYGWKGLFLRGYFETRSHDYDPTLQLLLDKIVRGIIVYLSLAAILLRRRQQISGRLCTAVLVIAFLLTFPLAVPRYLAFTLYLSWLLASGKGWIDRRHSFVLIILGILLLAAPVVDVTRYAGIDMNIRLQRPAALFEKAYFATDYDAYSSLCRTIQYTDTAGSTHGRQLAGVLLFFVPRGLWPGKPIGSGAYLFTQLNFDFKNVSCTYLAEGYINFGLAGSLLFTLLMAACITGYDTWFRRRTATGCFSYAYLFYFVSVGMLLFILRGDLLSSAAFTCGLWGSGWLLHQLLCVGRKKTEHGRT